MKNIILLIFINCLTFVAKAQTTIIDSIMSDGVWRNYRLYIPANYSASGPSRPLIFNMHGLGSNAVEQQFYSNFMPIADTAGFLMVYPQGLYSQGTSYWNVGMPAMPPTDDVKFISSLLDTISDHYHIDAQRVYATGMSLGGYMCHYLALNLNDRIAAIASVTGTIYPAVYTTANPGRIVPVMQIHGTADATVPYTGNTNGIHIDSLVSFWVKNDGCNAVPVTTNVPDINTTDGCTAIHYVYNSGLQGSTCEFYKIIGGDHTWPGAPISIGVTNKDFSASAEIWRFFRPYRIGPFVSVPTVVPAAAAISISPNPCYSNIHISGASPFGQSMITDITGREMIRTSSDDIDMSDLPAGVYLFRYSGASWYNCTVIKQ